MFSPCFSSDSTKAWTHCLVGDPCPWSRRDPSLQLVLPDTTAYGDGCGEFSRPFSPFFLTAVYSMTTLTALVRRSYYVEDGTNADDGGIIEFSVGRLG